MNNKSCALFRLANMKIMDYPFRAAAQSALSICDEIVIVVSDNNEDHTLHALELSSTFRDALRVTIVQDTFTYDLGWQERWWNTAVSHTDADWLLWLDADEVIDPYHADTLRTMMADPDIKLIRFPFIHLYATANYEIGFPLTHNTRLGRRSVGYRMVNLRSEDNPHGAACAAVFDGNKNAHSPDWPEVTTVDFPILHYGWCRDAQALAISQAKQAAWYADGDNLEDGRLPDVEPYDFRLAHMLEAGRARPFTGEHPGITQLWRDAHRAAWAEIESGVTVCA